MKRIVSHLKQILRVAGRMPGTGQLVLLQLLSGLTSVLGLPLLVPVLRMLEDKGAGAPDDRILHYLTRAVAFTGFEPSFLSVLFLMSTLVISSILLDVFVKLLGQYRQYQMFADCSLRLLNGYLNVRWPWLVEHHSGEINHALYNETARWSEAAFQAVRLITTSIQGAAYILVAIYISWQGSLAAAVIIAFLLFVNIILSQQIKRISYQKNEIQKQFAELVQSVQQNRKFLKSSMLSETFKVQFGKIIEILVKQAKGMALRTQVQQGWTQSGVFIVLVFLLALHEQLGLGYAELIVLLASFARMMPQITALSSEYAAFATAFPVHESLESRLKELEAEKETLGGQRYVPGSPAKLINVGFKYKDGPLILRQASIDIPPKQSVAIIGKSGEGKSTILDLLLGLWEPESGDIMYGSINHRSMDFSSLRSRVAYVGQETTLFGGTIRENLSLGPKAPSKRKIVRVLETVQLNDLVRELPLGLATVIGENGVRLSGGQRQRMAIARALLMDPDILILDEATSALDSATEEKILKALFERLHSKITILLVTHRMSAVKFSDHIYIVESGNLKKFDPANRERDFGILGRGADFKNGNYRVCQTEPCEG